MDTDPEAVVRDYYDALRQGEPLEPSFLEADSTVKFGISETLYGYDAVADALREQTATTTDWTVESHALEVATHEPAVDTDATDGTTPDEPHATAATFADEVTMAWRSTDRNDEYEFETRWSGTLVPADSNDGARPEWRFALMHVSTAGST
ncbi:DUF3225 domain-containing protein [Salinadaptatus halalkaliphilus]|uniref:DUF3225 domain-containing protein n=1 Tax=Salinadaptatus halalkaliphilus TaxID=2419781 RepID=A0A4S3TLU3_9EURY|nr:DUF3225 domain-containing protein [Salinadaptatus halalkaliphilus]THE65164.1 DUF3225 domain-containing protein [Salinadaptatus halalkaliphilus]